MCVTAVTAGCKFPIYCCPVNFKTAEKSNPKPFSIGFRVFFFKDQAPESQIMMVGFAAGAGQEPNGLAQSALSKEGECPFLVEEKQAFAPPTFRTNPKGQVVVVQMSPDWEEQRHWRLFR